MRMLIFLLLTGCLTAACSGEPPASPAPPPGKPQPELEVFAEGADLAGANGIHFGPDGLLYVASALGSDITVLDPQSGERVKRLTAADGVIGPDDVAFASDGSYYWTSILTGEVAGFDATGTKVIAAQLPPGPNPITFSDDDRLFVAQCFLGTNVYELDPAGVQAPRIIADDLGPRCGLNGMDWGPDDRLYGPRWFVGEVISLDVDSGEHRVEATGFTTPAAVKFDSEGTLHVLDTGSGEVVQVKNGEKEVVATLDTGLDNFAFDANDTLFVSSFVDGFVKRVEADGTTTTLQPGGMAHPGGLAVAGPLVWVADLHAIRGFDRQTGEAVTTQRNIVGISEMGGAINLSSDGANLVLNSWFDNDVRVWDPEAQRRVAHYPDLAAPVAAVRYLNGMAIAEHGISSVTLYGDKEKKVLADNLPAPTGLVASGSDLYVSDRSLGQILLVAQEGQPLPTPTVVASELQSPEGFLVVDGGFVVVEAEAARLVYVDASGKREIVADLPPDSPGTPVSPPSQVFNGVAMDEEGNLFISGETARELYRIKAPWR